MLEPALAIARSIAADEGQSRRLEREQPHAFQRDNLRARILVGRDRDRVVTQAKRAWFGDADHGYAVPFFSLLHRSAQRNRTPMSQPRQEPGGGYSTPSVSPVGGGNSWQQSSSQARNRTTLGNEK